MKLGRSKPNQQFNEKNNLLFYKIPRRRQRLDDSDCLDWVN
ncbi:MAG: hypothetical protein ACI9JY_001086 [Saprospiraceae bacterium]|jgi:hypothetical protein